MARQARVLKAEHVAAGTRGDPAALKAAPAAEEITSSLLQDERPLGREAPRFRAASEQAMRDRARRLRLELARRDELDQRGRLAANAVWLERLRDSTADEVSGPKRSQGMNAIAAEGLKRPHAEGPDPCLPRGDLAPAGDGTEDHSGAARRAGGRLHHLPPRPASFAPESGAPKRRQIQALPKWRLKRVAEYVDTNLAAKITLSDLAAVAGLSRMHFACQFRVATSLRPHEFVLQRRVRRAEELLRDTSYAILDIALTVGFETQAHFATVFRRFTGCTPRLWRMNNAGPRHLARDPDGHAPYA